MTVAPPPSSDPGEVTVLPLDLLLVDFVEHIPDVPQVLLHVVPLGGGLDVAAVEVDVEVVEDGDWAAGGVRDVARYDVVTGERHIRRPAHAVPMLQHSEITAEFEEIRYLQLHTSFRKT